MDDEPGATDVTVVNVEVPEADPPASAELPADVWPTLTDHAERLARVEDAISVLSAAAVETAEDVQSAQLTADIALSDAEAAVEIAAETSAEVEQVAEEAAEADAAIAEEADAMTAEVAEEIEEVAPKREHSWFAKRQIFKRGD